MTTVDLRALIERGRNFFAGRQLFMQQVLEHIDNPELLEALLADGAGDEEAMFCDFESLYKKLNSGGSKTRDWLIVTNALGRLGDDGSA